MNVRTALLGFGLAFGVFETIDIPSTGVPALVVALVFYACSAWLWRRDSRIAAVVIGAVCVLEVTQAHTWKHASAAAKDFAVVAGIAAIVTAAAYVAGSGRLNRRAECVGVPTARRRGLPRRAPARPPRAR